MLYNFIFRWMILIFPIPGKLEEFFEKLQMFGNVCYTIYYFIFKYMAELLLAYIVFRI